MATGAKVSNQVWNVPNVLSMIRLIMAFAVVALIPLGMYWTALVLFVIAASTDWMDGWWARRFQQVTQLGRMLDPFCDKMIICGAYITLAPEMTDFPWYAGITGWMAVIIMGREMLVTALRSFIEQSGGDFSAKWAGKLKMVFQCVAVVAALWALTNAAGSADSTGLDASPLWLVTTLIVFVWLALLTTLYSGLEYVLVAARFMAGIKSPETE